MLPYNNKAFGAWFGDGWAGEDDYNISIYTDSTHTTYFTMPKTGARGNNGNGQYVNPSSEPFVVLCHSLHSFGSSNVNGAAISLRPDSKFSRPAVFSKPCAILPIDDSVGPDPADYPTKEQWQASQGGSGAPSASSSLGRYTVMRLDSGSLF